jgi:hypothetical protein
MNRKLILPFLALAIFTLFQACNETSSADQTATDETQPEIEALTEAEQTAALQKGKGIAQATFAALSGQLKSALQEGGVPHAIEYCNLVAFPLVDSLSEVHSAQIRRTTNKVRNPKDIATETERPVLNNYLQQAAKGEELKPLVELVDPNTVAFYAPIKIQPLCLNCHGKVGEVLTEENYAVIKEKYPEDEAVGYQLDEFRGMWSIQFDRSSL